MTDELGSTTAPERVSKAGYDLGPISTAERDELAARLTPEERHVLFDHGTERPFCGALLNNKEPGVYVCRLCGLPLFRSGAKFESGTGWPSFYEPFDRSTSASIVDRSLRDGRAPRSAAPAATATSATSSRTARRRPTSATA